MEAQLLPGNEDEKSLDQTLSEAAGFLSQEDSHHLALGGWGWGQPRPSEHSCQGLQVEGGPSTSPQPQNWTPDRFLAWGLSLSFGVSLLLLHSCPS